MHTRADNLQTTIKVVVNGIIMAGVVNDPDGLREMFLDNRDACPELLDILEEELNVLAGGTCTNNRKLFSLKDIFLTLLMGCERGTPK